MSVATLIIGIASLVIMVVTLVITYKTYQFTKKTYMFTENNSKANIKKQLREKENRVEELTDLIKRGTWERAYVTNEHFDERDKLRKEIEYLKDML